LKSVRITNIKDIICIAVPNHTVTFQSYIYRVGIYSVIKQSVCLLAIPLVRKNRVLMNMRYYPTLLLDTNQSKGTACSKKGHGVD